MSTPEPGDRGNPFQFLMGDLVNMLGSGAADPWELARSFAVQVATGGTAEPNIDPVARIRVEELARVAELHVAEATGLPLTADGRRLTCVPVGRADWAVRALAAWRPLLGALVPEPTAGGASVAADPMSSLTSLDLSASGQGGFEAMLGQLAAAMGPMFAGMQIGSVVGHLAQRALGQFVLPLPWPPSGELLVVTANVAGFAADWSLPEDEVLLWTCVRELASSTVLSVPSVRAHIEELLATVTTAAGAAQSGLAERLGSLGTGGTPDPEALQAMFGDPEALLGDLVGPETRWSSDRLTAVAVVVDAYADHVATRVAAGLIGSHTSLAEAWYRRRIERGMGEEAAGTLFGMDLGPEQVDRGRAFVAGVIERAGEEGLARLWERGRALPTPAEVDAPGLWLERLDLAEDEPPGN